MYHSTKTCMMNDFISEIIHTHTHIHTNAKRKLREYLFSKRASYLSIIVKFYHHRRSF